MFKFHTKSVQITNKVCSNFTYKLHKKIYSTCSHIKSVQKSIQSIQKTTKKFIQISHINFIKKSVQLVHT